MADHALDLREWRRYWAPSALVVALLASAIAGIFGAKAWVAGAAAVVAIVAGWRTITTEISRPGVEAN
jgi:hypothetical protein